MRPEKTIRIYMMTDEEYRKKWYTMEMLVKAFPAYFKTQEDFYAVDSCRSVRKLEMAIQTEEYRLALKEGLNRNYFGVKYQIEKFYRFEDVKKGIEKKFKKKPVGRYKQPKKAEHLRKQLNQIEVSGIRRQRSKNVVMVDYYGDERMGFIDKSDQFRLYYGMFFMKPIVDKMFMKTYQITRTRLEILTHLFMYKYFTRYAFTEFYNRAKDAAIGTSIDELTEDGFIERVTYEKNSLYKKANSRHSFRITAKTEMLIKKYIDAVMLKVKLPYDGHARSQLALTKFDIGMQRKGNTQWYHKNFHIPYTFYEHIYNWTNFKAEFEYISEDNLKDFNRMTSEDFLFNPYLIRYAEHKYLATNGKKDNALHIERFLKSNTFGWGIHN